MIQTLSDLLGGVSPLVIITLLVVVVVQCILQVYGVVDLIRRTEVAGGRKWLWAVIIVCGGLLGAMVYLAMGRIPTDLGPGDTGAGGEGAARQAIDRLYGDKQ